MAYITTINVVKNQIIDDVENKIQAGVILTINLSGFDSEAYDVIVDSLDFGLYEVVAEKSSRTSFTFTIPKSFYNDIVGTSGTYISFKVDGYEWDPYLSKYWKHRFGWYYIWLPVPASYKPVLNVSNPIPLEGSYNGKFVAGISSAKLPFTVTHNDPDDTIDFGEPICRYPQMGHILNADINNSQFETVIFGESEYDYEVRFEINVKDGRNRKADEVVKTITVYGYRLPSFNQQRSYVSRCDSSGKVDGMGEYAKLHLELSCAPIDGTNEINSVRVSLGNEVLTPVSGSIEDGYLNYFFECAIDETADLVVVITDNIASNQVTQFSIPQGTMPLSLYDGAQGTGSAFGQMATKEGAWFYDTLFFMSKKLDGSKQAYYLAVDENTGLICARKALGIKEKVVNVKIRCEGSRKSELYLNIYLNGTQAYGLPPKAQISQGGQVTFQMLAGEYLVIAGFDMYSMEPGLYGVYNGTELIDECDISYGGYSLRTDNIYVNDNIELVCKMGSWTPTEYRKKVTVKAEGADSNYSLWEKDEIYSSNGEDLVFYIPSGNTYSFRATCVKFEKPLYWTVGSTKYNTEDLDNITINSNTTITAHFGIPKEMIKLSLNLIGGMYFSYFQLLDADGNELFSYAGRDASTTAIVDVPKNEEITLYAEMPHARLITWIIDGVRYDSEDDEQSLSVVHTFTADGSASCNIRG